MTKGMENLMQMLEKNYDVYKKITKYPPGESGKNLNIQLLAADSSFSSSNVVCLSVVCCSCSS